MKFLPLIALMFVGCQGAVAQTPECSTVPKASDRLACYDRATPPSAAKSATSKQKAAASSAIVRAHFTSLLALNSCKDRDMCA